MEESQPSDVDLTEAVRELGRAVELLAHMQVTERAGHELSPGLTDTICQKAEASAQRARELVGDTDPLPGP